ncbi:MAG: type II toxin-antitoxin system RelB/DinJ family antitoxin [Patescibacteria group bacterium]
MITKNNEQIQIRIDAKTKTEVKKILDQMGLDISSAVKLFFHQVINARNFPCELRDVNGFTLRNAEILRKSIIDAENSEKSFNKGSALIKDALKD